MQCLYASNLSVTVTLYSIVISILLITTINCFAPVLPWSIVQILDSIRELYMLAKGMMGCDLMYAKYIPSMCQCTILMTDEVNGWTRRKLRFPTHLKNIVIKFSPVKLRLYSTLWQSHAPQNRKLVDFSRNKRKWTQSYSLMNSIKVIDTIENKIFLTK